MSQSPKSGLFNSDSVLDTGTSYDDVGLNPLSRVYSILIIIIDGAIQYHIDESQSPKSGLFNSD